MAKKAKKEKEESVAKKLKDNFEAIAKLRERSKEIQRLLTVEPIIVKEEQRLANELLLVFRAIERLEEERIEELKAVVPNHHLA